MSGPPATGSRPRACVTGSPDPGRAGGHPRVPARGRGRRPRPPRRPAAARARPHRPPVRHHRPATAEDLDQALHIERDGDGLRRALRDRRRRPRSSGPATRSTSRRTDAARRSTAPTPRCRCTRRRSPRTPARCCPTRSGRRCCGRSGSTRTGEGTDVTRRARAGPLAGQARLRDGPADDRRRVGRRSRWRCWPRSVELRLAREAARGGVSLPLPEQEIDVEGDHWRLEFRSLLPVERVERPDLPAHRFRGGVVDGLRPGRAAAHAAAAGPARRTTPAPHRARTGHRVAGRDALPRLHPHPRPRAADPRRDGRMPAPGCCAAAGTSPSTARCRPIPSTPRWPRSTPT